MHISTRKKPVWKVYIFYDSNSMALQKRQNHGDRKEFRVATSEQGGRDETNTDSTRDS